MMRSLLVAAMVLFALGPAAAETLKIYDTLPSFTLTDAANKPQSSDALKGKVWVAAFFLTNCSGPCPMVLNRLAGTAREIPNANFRIAAISVDPENDTPEALSRYAASFGADPRWIFLTGPRELLSDLLTTKFRVGFSPSPQAHSTNLVLIDAEGRIRGYYSGLRPEDFERLLSDIRKLL